MSNVLEWPSDVTILKEARESLQASDYFVLVTVDAHGQVDITHSSMPHGGLEYMSQVLSTFVGEDE